MNTRALQVLAVVVTIALLAPSLCSAQAQVLWVGPGGDHAIIGIDPEFVDLPNLDLRVEAGSVAVDAGVANPPGGLGAADIRGGIRNLGAAPDAGAYEGDINLTFSDGFDVGSSWHWSAVVGGTP